MANKKTQYKTSAELKGFVADCASILMVGDECNETLDFISGHFDLNKLVDQEKNKFQDVSAKNTCRFKKIGWCDIGVKIAPQKFDCVIANAVGAMSLVKTDCKSFGTYSGVPAKRIGERNSDLLILEKKFAHSIDRNQKLFVEY